MTTETQEAPKTEKKQAVKLVSFRAKMEGGLPKTGFGILAGHYKSGKSTLAADWPGAYIIETEKDGAEHIDGRVDECLSLDRFRGVLPIIAKDSTVQTIVIDTIDEVSDWFGQEIAMARGLSSMSEKKSGVNGFELWDEHFARIKALVKFIEDCGKFAIICAHCRKPEKNDDGAIITPAGINVPGKGGAYLPAKAKFIGYCLKKPLGTGVGYYVTFQGGPALGLWGSRIRELNDKTIQLPEANPFSAIKACFPEKKAGAA